MKKIYLILFLVLSLCLTFVLSYDLISNSGDIGTHSKTVLDSNGIVHAISCNSTNLAYANNSGGTWNSVNLPINNGCSSSDLSIDSNDNIHIISTNTTNIKYCNNSNGWICTNIISNANVRNPKIITDSNNIQKISYFNMSSGGIYYYCNNSNGWSCDIAFTNCNDSSICYDYSMDVVKNITYISSIGGDSKIRIYRKKPNESWNTNSLLSFNKSQGDISLYTLNEDDIRFVHRDTNDNLLYCNGTFQIAITDYECNIVDNNPYGYYNSLISVNNTNYITSWESTGGGGGDSKLYYSNNTDTWEEKTILKNFGTQQYSNDQLAVYKGNKVFTSKISNFIHMTFVDSKGTEDDIWNYEKIYAFNKLPNKTIVNYPINNSNNVSINPIINITVNDIDSSFLNVSIINNSDDTIICQNNSISSGNNVLCSWNNLNVGDNYKFYINVTDGESIVKSGFTNFTTDSISPIIDIINPENKNYGTNESLPLNYTVSDSGVGVDTCWYKVVNETGSLIISNTTLINCTNSTFDLPAGDINYNLTLYSNDTNGNVNSSVREFGVRTNVPAIDLKKPTNNNYLNINNLNFSFVSDDSDGIDTCKLYGNWTGSWKVNETFNNVTSGNAVSTLKNISDSQNNIWNVWCNDSFGNSAYALNNYSFYVDTINPNHYLDYINTTKGSQTIHFKTISNDINLKECYYSIYKNGNIDGLNNNVTYTCNTEIQATVTEYGSFNLITYSEDKARNINKTNNSFTTEETEIISGGGGGTTVINESNWSITTSGGGKRYELLMLSDQIETEVLYFENLGDEEREITLTCQIPTNQTYDFCKNVNIEKTEFTLPVLKEQATTVNFDVNTPKNIKPGEYTFNIIATDDRGVTQSITVLVKIPSGIIQRFIVNITSSAINVVVFIGSFIILPIVLTNTIFKNKFTGRIPVTLLISGVLSLLIISFI